MAQRILDAVAGLGGGLLFLAAAFLAFGETALFLDFVVPGEAGMVVTGAAGRARDLSLAGLVAAVTIGAIAGDSVSYLIGRRWGRSLVCRWELTRRHLEPKYERAERYFAHRGGTAVFFGRWVGALRAVVPAVAGSGGMPYPRFLLWNVLASISWVTATLALGYFAGRAIAELVDRAGLLLSVVVVGGVLTWWVLRRRRRADRPEHARA